MAIQPLYPSSRPTLNLHFAKVKALDPRITFARASGAAYYDGKTVAKAEENLFIRSQEFDNAGWSKGNISVTANTEVAPDGTTTADTITASAVNSIHIVSQTIVASSLPRVMSVFAKKGTNDYIQFCIAADGAPFANFDLDLGVVGTKAASVTSSITSVGNGWYRCTMEYTSAAGISAEVSIADSDSMARRAFWTALGTETVFLWGAQLEQRTSVTAYTATTTQPITQFQPVLLSESANVARFDHDPITGESLGLLIEEQRTNYLLYSSQPGLAGTVTNFNSTNFADYNVAPDGTQTASLVQANASTNSHGIGRSSASIPANTEVTLSAYVKAGTNQYAVVAVQSNTNWVTPKSVAIDLATGAVISGQGQVQDVGNGWYRVSLQATTNASTNVSRGIWVFVARNDGTGYHATNGTENIFVWGTSIEVGAFATSYIPTTTAQVTRAADSASMTGANFSSWYRPDEGSAFCIFSRFSNNTAPYPVAFTGGSNFSASPRISLRTDNNVNLAMQGVSTSGSVAWNFSFSGGGFQNIVINAGISFSSNSISAVAGGNAVVEVTPNIGVPSGIDKLFIGASGALNGHIRKISYYPQRLANVQLQSLTK